MIGLIVLVNVAAAGRRAAAQYPCVCTAHQKPTIPIIYGRHHWVVDMRRNDGDLRRVTCLSGVFACDGAYFPFHDHVDDGSLRHVDRYFADRRRGWYHQRGFIWTNRGQYRECAHWTHYYRVVPHRVR